MKKRNGIMTFRLPDDEKEKLAGFMRDLDCTLSDLAVRAVRDLIAKLEAAQEAQAPKPTPKKKKA